MPGDILRERDGLDACDILAATLHEPEFYGDLITNQQMTREVAFGVSYRFARIWMLRELAKALRDGVPIRGLNG